MKCEKKLTGANERKIRCIVRRKVQKLQAELPFLENFIPPHLFVTGSMTDIASRNYEDVSFRIGATESNNTVNQLVATKFSRSSNTDPT